MASFCLLGLLQMIVLLVIALIMIGIGNSFRDDCNNGATEYLITGGTIIISANIVPIVFSISVNLALCDNHISRTESFFLRILLFVKDIMPLAGIIVTIWVTRSTHPYFNSN